MLVAQGYGIARLMPAENIPSWLRDFQVAPEWLDNKKNDPSNQEYLLLLMAAEQHRLVSRVVYAIEQQMATLLPKQISNPHANEFGRWLEDEGKQCYGELAEFIQLKNSYHDLHKLYEQTVIGMKEDDYQALDTISSQLKEVRTQLLENLHLLRSKLRPVNLIKLV